MASQRSWTSEVCLVIVVDGDSGPRTLALDRSGGPQLAGAMASPIKEPQAREEQKKTRLGRKR